MRIKVRHQETEIIIEDNFQTKDAKYEIIYFNTDNVLILINEITQSILKIREGGNK
jgi:hypothetical protein